MSLGEKLRNLRLKENRTLKEQSELCGVKLNKVFRWEHDMAKPRQADLAKIAEVYGVTVAWLTQDCEPRSSNSEHDQVEKQLLDMFSRLSVNQKYLIMGYIERLYVEGEGRGCKK